MLCKVASNTIFWVFGVEINFLNDRGFGVEINFLNDRGLCRRDFFRLHWRKWISDVTRTNTVFDVEAGNRKRRFLEKILEGVDRSKLSSMLDDLKSCGGKKFFSE